MGEKQKKGRQPCRPNDQPHRPKDQPRRPLVLCLWTWSL